MKFKVIISDEALEDIQAVFYYISNTEGLPITAQHWLESVETAVKSLTEHPYLYPKYDFQIPNLAPLRKLVVGKYLVLYTVEDYLKLVSVLRVLSTRRNILSILAEESENG